MTPNFHSPMSPTFPVEPKEDHHHRDHQHHHHPLFLFQYQSPSSSSSSPAFFDQGGYYHREQSHHVFQSHHHQEEANKMYVSQGGSCDHNNDQTVRNESDDSGLKLTIWKKEERNENQISETTSSAKWMSSKMRLMKKMLNSETGPVDMSINRTPKLEDHQKQFSSTSQTENSCCNNNHNINNYTNTIRVCADCNTTKTPLWRSGPRGPKSLCNACGIRQRKARRAMAAAAAAAANGTVLANDAPPLTKKSKVQHKDKAISNKSCLPFKKRCKMSSPSPTKKKQLGFEDLTIILSQNSAYQRVFPQDEKEAAILLMALSYGLVHG